MTRRVSPVSGSGMSNFELVLPPPKLVMRRSSPSRFDRYCSSASGLSLRAAAFFSSQRFFSSEVSFVDESDTSQLHVVPEPPVMRVPAIGGRGLEPLHRKRSFDD